MRGGGGSDLRVGPPRQRAWVVSLFRGRMRRVLGGSAGANGEKSFEILVSFRIFSGLGGRLRIRFRIREMGAWCGHTTCPPLDPLLVSSRDADGRRPSKIDRRPSKILAP